METGALGRTYSPGEVIIRKGEVGDCMYVVQAGQVEVYQEESGQEVRLTVLNEGELFGEMAILESEVRSASVRALTDARVLTVNKKTFLRRVHEDPSLALHITEGLCRRIRELSDELVRLKTKMQCSLKYDASGD